MKRSGFATIYLNRNFLPKLVDGQRIHHAAVIARDNKEIMKTDPVFLAVVADAMSGAGSCSSPGSSVENKTPW